MPIINGTNDPDSLSDFSGNDIINALGGDDQVTVTSGSDTVDGGEGDDTLIVEWGDETAAVTGSVASGQFGNEAGRDVNFKSVENFYVTTGSGNDVISFGSGQDVVFTGAGNDHVNLGLGVLLADGGSGTDFVVADFRFETISFDIDLTIDKFVGPDGVIIRNFENGSFILGSGNDKVVLGAGSQSQLVLSGAGNDDISYLAAYGTAVGGDGADILTVEWVQAAGPVTGNAASFLDVAANRTLEYSGFETVILVTGPFNNSIAASDADDIISSLAGDDNIHGEGGNDRIIGGMGNDVLQGGTGTDIVSYSNVAAGVIVNLLTTTQQNTSGAGLDTISGFENLEGSPQADILTGDIGANEIFGLAGDDTLNGGVGNDQLFGGGGTDALNGGSNDDVLTGGAGNDTMIGAEGDDVYIVEDLGDVVVEAFSEGSEGASEGTADEVRTALGSKAPPDRAVYVMPAWIEILTGTSTGNQGVRDNQTSNIINMGVGHDLVVADAGGVDQVNGGAGNDFLYYGDKWTAADITNGGSGVDTISLIGNYGAIVFNATNLVGVERMAMYSALYLPGTGPNNYNVTMHDANVAAGVEFFVTAASLQSNESLTFNGAAETNGRFTVHGGAGGDTMTGGASSDFFIGNGGNDVLNGGGGADFLIGGAGADQLNGGVGADQFRFANTAHSTTGSADQILDFEHVDRIDLSAIDANGNAGDGNQAFSWIGTGAFTNVAGQLRIVGSAGNWTVQGDTNGDGIADLVIQVTVTDATPLGAGDFIL